MESFRETVIAKTELTDLDLMYPFYSGPESETRNDVEIPWDEICFSESPSAPIDEIISILTRLKESGADRVYIHDHCDHHGYYFTGVKLEKLD
jgi:hypothetical protein